MAWICGYNTWLTIHNIMGLTCLGGGEYFYFISILFSGDFEFLHFLFV
jgi:hypothetical protein